MQKISTALRSGCGLGLLIFLVGFIGPVILTREANQGPSLGIFITGPVGFVIGLVGGAVSAGLYRDK